MARFSSVRYMERDLNKYLRQKKSVNMFFQMRKLMTIKWNRKNKKNYLKKV